MKLCLSCQTTFESEQWSCPQCGNGPLKRDGFLFFAPELVKENESFPSDSHDILLHYEADHFWFRSRSRLILWLMKKYFKNAQNFFEVGCGNGFVLSCVHKNFPHLNLYGCEMYLPGLINTSKRLPQAELFQMDIRKIPFCSEFDVIGAFDVLEHVPEDQKVLNILFQAVKPGGGIILTVPQHAFLWTHVDDYSGHQRRYSAKDLVKKAQLAGFKIERTGSFIFLLLPLMILNRFLIRNNPQKFDIEAEFKIGRFTNYLLENILTFERLLIRIGFKLPWGGSLFLVARKN